MFKKLPLLSLAFFFLILPKTHATLPLNVEDFPSAVDADVYTIIVSTQAGAKVTVTGGTSQIPPVTDTDEDGIVKITVGLIQNSKNNFSIRAELAEDSSDSLSIVINESTAEAGNHSNNSGEDITPPNQPRLDDYATEVNSDEMTFTGRAENGSTIYAQKTDGTELAKTTTEKDGTFSVTVKLEQNTRNRINISAEDNSGNTSTAIQAVVVESGEETSETKNNDNDETAEEKKGKISDIATEFTDTNGHWAEEYIKTLRLAGIIGGKNEGIFAPDESLTRAEIVKIALNAFTVQLDEVSKKPFDDVELTDWFVAYVTTAKNKKIVSDKNHNFSPNANVTRAEALKILLVTAGFEITNGTTDFIDITEKDWYEDYIAFASDNEIVGGYKDGTFKPNQSITRAEIAKITVKTIELYTKKIAEENNDETKTGSGSDLIDGNRLYKNTNFNFSLQFYKNWYYEGTTGSGNTITRIGFSEVEDAIDNAEVVLELKTDSLKDIEKTDLETEISNEEIRYYVDYSETKHIEIYGNTAFAEKIKIMAETVEVEN